MATLDQVLQQMRDARLPPLLDGHPVTDGKIHRYGPKKKAWYALREILLQTGKIVVTGAFGIWQGDNKNSQSVSMDWQGVSPEERDAAEAQRKAFELQAAQKKQRLADAAANRAGQQWAAAARSGQSDYIARKQITAPGMRYLQDGTLLVPMLVLTDTGVQLAGLQKIAPDGVKRFSTGMAKQGAYCPIGRIDPTDQALYLAEGYATGRSVRMASNDTLSGYVAFDAGNLIHVARMARANHPDVHILFCADDDYRLTQRLAEWLQEDFKIAVPVEIDGIERTLVADDGAEVSVIATWRNDAAGVPYIEADARSGRMMTLRRFENAGIARAMAAALEIGNASVVWPRFTDRAGRKWTDFNDLHVEQSLADVQAQIDAAIHAALAGPEVDLPPALSDAVPPGGCIEPEQHNDATAAVDLPPLPSDMMPPSDCIEPEQHDDAAPAAIPESLSALASEPSPDAAPAPPFAEWAEAQVAAFTKPSMGSLLEHFAVIWGSTDVWDGLNRQRIKKAAFASAVGKDIARQWLEHPERRTIDADALPVLKRGRAVDTAGGGGGDRLNDMLNKITLLYGTVTVWDSEKRIVMALDAMRAAYGPDMVKRWQEHALRAMIDSANLVFDPTQRVDPATHINMFAGFPLIPKQDDDKCLPVLELVFDLCGSEENPRGVGDWLLKWLAYPLQHPGAKMQTAVLMFGEKQGTGKSLFFEGIMRPVYGEYGGTAGQHQLDSSFTDWKSRKIYMVFEEVLSREERYSHIGTLKHMITGRDMRVNPKNLPERVESNHLNCVFLSNESQPIPIELEDRRWLVIEARNKLAEAFLSEIKALMKEGVSEAFYHFLLNYPLGDFDEHTKPPMTEAKRKIIRFGRQAWDAFHEAWKEGDLAAPYCSCMSSDLFTVYARWCDRNHERKLSQTKFGELLGSRETKAKKLITMGQTRKTKMVFLIDAQEGEALNKACQKFRDLADIVTPFE